MRTLLIVILLIFVVPVFGQNALDGMQIDTTTVTVKKFDNATIKKYQSQKAFDYSDRTIEYQKTWFDKVIDWFGRILEKFFETLMGVENATGILKFLFKALPYIIGLLFLYLLIKFFMNKNGFDFISTAKNRKLEFSDLEEELIRSSDLPALLQQAISDQNYRVAVRYYYLLLLKRMDEAKLILWEHQKTNEDFINEISSTDLKDSFSENTRLYDFVWYGDFSLTQNEFLKAELDFKATHELIKNHKK